MRGAYSYLDGIIQNVYEYGNGEVTRARVMSIPLTDHAYLAPSTWNDLVEEDESVQRAVDRLVEEDTVNRVREVQSFNRDHPGVGFPGLPSRVKDELSLQTTSRASRRSDKLPGRFGDPRFPDELTAAINKFRTGGRSRRRRRKL